MVATRSGKETSANGRSPVGAVLLVVSVLVGLLAVSGSYVVFQNVEDHANSLYHRGRYAFTGGAADSYWQSIPSWEDVKDYTASATGQVLPEPSIWEKTKAFALRKPVRQVQAEAAYASGKGKAQDASEYAKQAAQDASAKASETYDAATDAAARAQDQARSVPDKVRQLLFGIKSKAVKEADRQRRIHADAAWRAEHASKQGFFAKLAHVVAGPSDPSQKHWDDAKAAGSAAYDHAGNAAGEAYEAAKEAAASAVSGGKSAARSAQGAGNVAADIGSRAAGSAAETYDAAKESAGTASEYAQAGYDKSAEAAAAAKAKADAAYNQAAAAAGTASEWTQEQAQAAADAARAATGQAGLTAEEAAHRAQEAAQQAKHRAQETAHQATA